MRIEVGNVVMDLVHAGIPLIVCYLAKVVHAVQTVSNMRNDEVMATVFGHDAIDVVCFILRQGNIATD
jgi:hypothetical protein